MGRNEKHSKRALNYYFYGISGNNKPITEVIGCESRVIVPDLIRAIFYAGVTTTTWLAGTTRKPFETSKFRFL